MSLHQSNTPPGKLFLVSLLLAAAALTAACGGVPAETPAATQPPEAEGPVDPDAQSYRMFFDGEVRRFTGQLHLPNLEEIFGDLNELPQDRYGNYVGGPIFKGGLFWTLILSPSQSAANLVTWEMDGTVSSSIDLDGDRTTDIVDIRLGDGRHFSFATELLGMGVFEDLFLGRNPLCDGPLAQELGLDLFGCGDDTTGEAGGGSGSFGGNGSGIFDPFDALCANYETSGLRAAAAGVNRSINYSFQYQSNRVLDNSGRDIGDYHESTLIFTDDTGQHTGTVKYIEFTDTSGELVRTVEERVDNTGFGERVITDHREDGTTATRRENFRTHLFEDGDYGSYTSSPPMRHPNGDPDFGVDDEELAEEIAAAEAEAGEEPPPPPPPPPQNEDPGPEGDDSNIAAMCQRRANYRSGAEQAADTDPTEFGVSCDDLVGAPASDDCVIIAWARPEDFEGVLHPPATDDGCDDFEQPGEDGTCGPSSGIQRLRGLTSLILSANLEGFVLCSPLVCGGELFDEENVELLSLEGDDVPDFATVTPESDGGDSDEPTQPTINTTTPCWQGPGSAYPLVLNLVEGQLVNLLGIAQTGNWFIVQTVISPGDPCWVDMGNVDIDPDLDFGALVVYPIPSLPSEGGGETSGGGEGNGEVQCAEDEYFSEATQQCEVLQ